MSLDISIIIVNYNSKELLINCLASIKQNVEVNYEVIIVDNNSSDDSFVNAMKEYDDINFVFVKSDVNLGFSKANNIGVLYAKSLVYHFLNPDTIVTKDTNIDYECVLKNTEKVYVTPLINLDGSLENSKNCIPTIKNNINRFICPSRTQYWYIGASVIISKLNFDLIGKWCEDYFMYSEDIDLFYRINKANIPILELKYPILHIGGGCTKNVWRSIDKELVGEKSYYLFYKKNISATEYYVFKVLTIIYLFFINPSKAILKLRAWMIFLKKK